ncbi:MAG: hypothetical protein SCH71_05490 [Desulfobulbaceae bacterium]|nr:hypothetical protein [Desulfobulbaceae bacterium]
MKKSEDTPPDETRTVALAEHVIRSNHTPRFEVLLNGKRIGEILFHLQLALKLEGFLLIIQGGRTHEIRSGDCQVSGVFKCEDIVLLEKRKQDRSGYPALLPLSRKKVERQFKWQGRVQTLPFGETRRKVYS